MMEGLNVTSTASGTCDLMDSVKENIITNEEEPKIPVAEEGSKSNGIDLLYTIEDPVVKSAEQVTVPEELYLVTEKAGTNEVTSGVNNEPTIAAITEAEVLDMIQNVHTTIASNSENVCEPATQNEGQLESNENEKVSLDNLPKVEFETEILVESNDNENVAETNSCSENSDAIMKELDHATEFSDAVNSSDVTDNVENNNDCNKQEVFNKEELIHILEGKEQTNVPEAHSNEFLVAVEQLAQLRMDRKSRHKPESKDKKRPKNVVKVENTSPNALDIQADKDNSKEEVSEKNTAKSINDKKKSEKPKETIIIHKRKRLNRSKTDSEKSKMVRKIQDKSKLKEKKSVQTSNEKKQANIISALVMDWDDDDEKITENPDIANRKSSDNVAVNTSTEDENKVEKDENKNKEGEHKDKEGELKDKEGEHKDKEGEHKDKEGEHKDKEGEHKDKEGVHKAKEGESKETAQSTPGDDTQPPKRLSRVIKKKVIFDPDNPDTFTKGKTVAKARSEKDTTEKDLPPVKKIKTEPTTPRGDSKSPTGRSVWKKPPPKQSKQNKRLSEVDRLLMDEGAVNMIYQLTPEAPKGKKNMKTKAEIIKKLQSTTPDSNEMKFRERKKENIKVEDGEAKKILGGKQRSSMSSSVKSFAVSEDFENHSADDSIIYRRHSSSSYESNCMSPRRLSDIENSTVLQQPPDSQNEVVISQSETENESIIFESAMEPKTEKDANESQNNKKSPGSSIKAKLSSKLSSLLNKKKSKTENLGKTKKLKFQYISVSLNNQIVEICIMTKLHTAKVLNELTEALIFIDSMPNVSVTLLTSTSGSLCSELDLMPLLNPYLKDRTEFAFQLAESIKSLLLAMQQHQNLLISGVWSQCSGLSIPMLTLCDLAFATDTASFKLDASEKGLPQPGTAVFNLRSPPLLRSLVMDLVICNRAVSSTEAVVKGLVHGSLWSIEHLNTIAQNMSSQPIQALKMKKKLLHSGMGEDHQATFQKHLEVERDTLVQYWTSVEGQELLRSIYGIE